jgi:hypothetical protein
MIIIILFATFVSLFFQSTQYQTSENFFEGFEQDNKKDKKSGDDDEEEFIEETGESEGKNENEKQEKDSKKKDKMEGYKYSFQGEKPDISTNDDEEEDFSNIQPSKTSQLKKDMEQYFEIQKELLTVLEKAEPLQKKAEAFKERFNTKK